MSIFLKSKLAT